MSCGFDEHEFWQHEDMVDVFFKPVTITFDDAQVNVILWGSWLTQGVDRWFFTPAERARITIPVTDVGRWRPYSPRGRIKL